MTCSRRTIAIVATIVLAMSSLAACSLNSNEAPADENEDQVGEANSNEETATPDAQEGDESNENVEEMSEDEGDDAAEDEHANGDDEVEYEGLPEVEVIESDMGVEVTSNDYTPESDVLIGLHGENDPSLHLISSDGEVLEEWRITNRYDSSMLDRRVLDNGNIMFIIVGDGAYEMNREGEIVWDYQDEGISHHAEILPNGNVLLVGAICDCVKEVDYETQEEIWYWDAHEAFPNYTEDDDAFHRGEEYGMINLFEAAYNPEDTYPSTWAHANYAQVLENDNVIVSLRNFGTVVEVNREGETVWSFGPGVIKHQHTPVDLEDGTMLIYDNGNARAIRVDRGTGEILWSHGEQDSPIMGEVSPLDDGNYKVVDSLQFSIDVVSPDEEVLWNMEIEPDGHFNGIYRAHFPNLED